MYWLILIFGAIIIALLLIIFSIILDERIKRLRVSLKE
jgi:hypothetical protein